MKYLVFFLLNFSLSGICILLRKQNKLFKRKPFFFSWGCKPFEKTKIDVENFDMNCLRAAKFYPVCSHYTDIHKSPGFSVYIKTVFVIELSILCRVGIL